jgi:hypothetical protein
MQLSKYCRMTLGGLLLAPTALLADDAQCTSEQSLRGVKSMNNTSLIQKVTIEENSSIARAIFECDVTNNGRVSNSTIGEGVTFQGGILTGYIINQGTIKDVDFRGASITGGMLSGAITVPQSLQKIGLGYFTNVELDAEVRIDGGIFSGEIKGDPSAPATLVNVEIRAGSKLSGVTLGDNVDLAENVIIEEAGSTSPDDDGKGYGSTTPDEVATAAFELLATKPLESIEIEDKIAAAEEALTAIATQIEESDTMSVVVGNKDIGRMGNTEILLPFPEVDYDMDGSPDDAGRMLEMAFVNDSQFLSLGLGYGIALPWQIAAYTYGDTLYVIAGVPQTVVRTYFNDVDDKDDLMDLATEYQGQIEAIVASALEPLDFTTNIHTAVENTQLDETVIGAIESAFGEELTTDFIAPSLTITNSSVDAETIIAAIENTFLADEVVDLNGNGEAGDEEDDAILPNAIMDFISGNMTFEELGGMLEQGADIWANGGAFQDWVFLRTLESSNDTGNNYYLMELCQPFYASMALGFGLYHMPSMPCAVGVWEDDEGVHVNLLTPQFIFGYFFADVAQSMDPTSPMMQIFTVFPTMVYNELAGIVNFSLRENGIEEQFEFKPFPVPTEE